MVSILMPVFNAEKFLATAIESVLTQTYRDFELIIIDDGSSDSSFSIAQKYAAADDRIVFLRQENEGMGKTLNRGLKLARHEWIVRMDSDDVMLPNRIERQLDFIEKNPEVSIISSCVYYINSCGEVVGKSKPEFTTSAEVRKACENNRLVGFAHPAVLMRKSVVESVGGYRKEFWPADDADLWNRVLEVGHSVLVQPEYLLQYRLHEGSVSVAQAIVAAERVAWVKECMRARRSGRSEPTREEFEKGRACRPLVQRLNSLRKAHCRAYYKAAVAAWANRRPLIAMYRGLSGLCLDPGFFFSKLRVRSFRS